MTEKIKVLLLREGMSAAQLARAMGTAPSTLYGQFKRDNFSELELHRIAAHLGCTFEGHFVLPDGERI